jgi:hypothetical protein
LAPFCRAHSTIAVANYDLRRDTRLYVPATPKIDHHKNKTRLYNSTVLFSLWYLVAEFLHEKTSIRYAEDSQNYPPNLPVSRSPDFLLLHRVGFQNSYQPFEPYSQTDGVGIPLQNGRSSRLINHPPRHRPCNLHTLAS